jgi:hypothetical protein
MREKRVLSRVSLSLRGTLVLIGLTLLSGCGGDGKIARYPVAGTVLVDGKPAEGVVIVFCPVSGTDEFMKERPFGTTDAEGKFTLMTFDPDDGAPAGDYKVLAQLPKGDADLLKGRYFKLNDAKLTATVETGTNELPPFTLTSH